MAGIAVTMAVAGAPQAGTQTIKCSAPANVGAVGAAVSGGLLTVTKADTGASALLGVNQIVEITNT